MLALHIECGQPTRALREEWRHCVEVPAEKAGLPAPKLIVLESPYRFVIQPILDYVLRLEHEHKDQIVAVVLPEMAERRWYEYFLHNQRGKLLAGLLLLQGDRRIVIVNVPWYLRWTAALARASQ